jgi:hypothetical protein
MRIVQNPFYLSRGSGRPQPLDPLQHCHVHHPYNLNVISSSRWGFCTRVDRTVNCMSCGCRTEPDQDGIFQLRTGFLWETLLHFNPSMHKLLS